MHQRAIQLSILTPSTLASLQIPDSISSYDSTKVGYRAGAKQVTWDYFCRNDVVIQIATYSRILIVSLKPHFPISQEETLIINLPGLGGKCV